MTKAKPVDTLSAPEKIRAPWEGQLVNIKPEVFFIHTAIVLTQTGPATKRR
jgi:hypothetical protein